MEKSLVIVESPAKAKTINKYLGNDYIVKSSVGHVRDLPVSGNRKPVDPKERAKAAALTRKMDPEEKAAHKKKKAKEQLVRRMGIDPENGWTAQYEIIPGKEKVLDELKKSAEKVTTVYLATDLDREGEAIAWHLREAIGGENGKFKRVIFNEITKTAITEAFKQPGTIDTDRVRAQQARRFLDRVVGFMVSPLLWAKVARGLSAGRVQSVAVRLIVEREREIHAFVPEEYWELHADLAPEKGAGSGNEGKGATTEKSDKQAIRFQVVKADGKPFKPKSREDIDKALRVLEAADYKVIDREDKPTKSKPPAPFITSTLQQSASTRLNYSVKKTMTLAQRLYEAGHITYMRTDSTNLSKEAIQAVRGYIEKEYGERYLPEKPNAYTSKEGAQEAHEAIRPTVVTTVPGSIKNLDRDTARLYELIWNQFVACQMPPAEFISTTVLAGADSYELKARGRITTFDGFMRVLPPATKKEDQAELPDIKKGDPMNLIALDPSQHFTNPPPRYTEASLVKELEKRGIGRPSTYASIISTIQDRGYVNLENRRFYAQKIGDIVIERLMENFVDLMDYNFTAEMEEHLDKIATGQEEWKKILDDFYADFKDKLDRAYEDQGMRPNDPVDTDITCPECGRKMQIRTASTGVFLGCSGYNLPPKERCKHTINLIHGDEAVRADDEEGETNDLRSRRRCPICGTAMDSYLIDETRKLHVCGNSPDCPGYEIEEGKFKIKGYEGPTLECDKCGWEMQLKTGRFGKYFGCTNPDCGNTRKLLKNGEPAPPKMDPVPMPELKCEKVDDYYLLRDGAAGIFLAASQFPKHRETRSPLVEELKTHADEIPEKYQYLLKAPAEDPDGNKAVVRFSRKNKEQYVMTEKDGKPTGWQAHFRNGRWTVTEKKSEKKSKKKSKS
jgi:DNA topoisomerase-1